MEQKNPGNLIQQRRPGVIILNTSSVAFAVLCAYLALVFLSYIDQVPTSLVSLTLYGFVGLMALAIVASGRVVFEAHTTWYFLFTLVCALSVSYAAYEKTSSEKVTDVVKLLIFSLVFMNAVNSKKRLRTTLFIIMISCFILYLNMAFTGKLDVDNRLGTDLTGNANTFASIFMIGAISSVYFIFFSEKRVFKLLSLVILLLQLYALALSGSRKFFLLPVVLLGTLKIFSTDKDGRKHLIRNTLIGLAVILGVWWMLFNVKFLYDAIGYRMEGMVAAFTGEGKVDASTQVRMELIDIAIDLWKESPLLGHGIDNYKFLNNLYISAYAHNNYAELLADVGLLGAVTYYSFYVYMIVKLIRAEGMRVERWYWALAVVCLAIFDYGAISYDMYPVHFLLLQATASLRLHNLKENEDEIQEVVNDEQDQNPDQADPAQPRFYQGGSGQQLDKKR